MFGLLETLLLSPINNKIGQCVTVATRFYRRVGERTYTVCHLQYTINVAIYSTAAVNMCRENHGNKRSPRGCHVTVTVRTAR